MVVYAEQVKNQQIEFEDGIVTIQTARFTPTFFKVYYEGKRPYSCLHPLFEA